jgi:hypothetical protein
MIAAAYLLLASTGCTGRRSPKTHDNRTARASASAGDPAENYFDGGSYCMQKFTQGPPSTQPLHFSNKLSNSDGSGKDFEAELSGDKLDQTIEERHPATDEDRKFIQDDRSSVWAVHDGVAEMTITNHYSRSDESGWRVGANGAVLGVAPWGLFIFKPRVSRIGMEQVNGYDTIKYAIDTTQESGMDKAPGLLRQLKDYNITGTAWVLKETGCVLQYDIEDEQVATDGKVSKTHYEGTVMRK